MTSVIQGIRVLVEEVYRTMPEPQNEHIARDVFFAIEENAQWLGRYQELCRELTSDVVNTWGSKHVKELSGLHSMGEAEVERGHIIRKYTVLGR